jgi:hypothetical protein
VFLPRSTLLHMDDTRANKILQNVTIYSGLGRIDP